MSSGTGKLSRQSGESEHWPNSTEAVVSSQTRTSLGLKPDSRAPQAAVRRMEGQEEAHGGGDANALPGFTAGNGTVTPPGSVAGRTPTRSHQRPSCHPPRRGHPSGMLCLRAMDLPRLHLVDGTYELFRAHFSPRPSHAAPDGRDNKATVGIASSLLMLLHDADEAPTHVAVAFDNPIVSFRNELFEGYKSDEGVPPELRSQFDAAEAACRALGITVWSMDRWEADDALATAAVRYATQVSQVRLLTPDKDLGQCVVGTRVVQVDRMRQRVLDEEAVRAARGVAPASIPDFLALTGDTADGIPGLPGFGEKTAAALLAHYGHLEAIPDDDAAWAVKIRGASRLAATLAAHRPEALLYRKLATLVTDVPLAEELDALRFRGVPRAEFEAWCDREGAQTLRTRPRIWAAP